jgi:flagellar basal-body rod modification protein FlgD
MTSPIAPVTDPSQTSSAGASSADTSSLGMAGLLDPSTFLNLLVDELKYQNPLDPTNSSDFMSQIAELSQVEQLQSVSSASQMGEAAGLIGKTVTASDASGDTISGVVSGVTNGTSGPLLNVGNTTVALSDVEQIGENDSSS